MKNPTPLTSKDGKSEWPYKETVLIAVSVKGTECKGCYFYPACEKSQPDESLPSCVMDFNDKFIKYIEKPATK